MPVSHCKSSPSSTTGHRTQQQVELTSISASEITATLRKAGKPSPYCDGRAGPAGGGGPGAIAGAFGGAIGGTTRGGAAGSGGTSDSAFSSGGGASLSPGRRAPQ